jgi:hypothetical protein
MDTKQKEAVTATATTPEVQHKDSNNAHKFKLLAPKFENLTAEVMKEHIKRLTKKTNLLSTLIYWVNY